MIVRLINCFRHSGTPCFDDRESQLQEFTNNENGSFLSTNRVDEVEK